MDSNSNQNKEENKQQDSNVGSSVTQRKIKIKTLDGTQYQVESDPEVTVLQFKQQLENVCSIPKDKQRLIFCGKQLVDTHQLSNYVKQDDLVLHLIKRIDNDTNTTSSSSNNNNNNNNNNNSNTLNSSTTGISSDFSGMPGIHASIRVITNPLFAPPSTNRTDARSYRDIAESNLINSLLCPGNYRNGIQETSSINNGSQQPTSSRQQNSTNVNNSITSNIPRNNNTINYSNTNTNNNSNLPNRNNGSNIPLNSNQSSNTNHTNNNNITNYLTSGVFSSQNNNTTSRFRHANARNLELPDESLNGVQSVNLPSRELAQLNDLMNSLMGVPPGYAVPSIPFRNLSTSVNLGNFLMRYQEIVQRIIPYVLRLGQLLSREPIITSQQDRQSTQNLARQVSQLLSGLIVATNPLSRLLSELRLLSEPGNISFQNNNNNNRGNQSGNNNNNGSGSRTNNSGNNSNNPSVITNPSNNQNNGNINSNLNNGNQTQNTSSSNVPLSFINVGTNPLINQQTNNQPSETSRPNFNIRGDNTRISIGSQGNSQNVSVIGIERDIEIQIDENTLRNTHTRNLQATGSQNTTNLIPQNSNTNQPSSVRVNSSIPTTTNSINNLNNNLNHSRVPINTTPNGSTSMNPQRLIIPNILMRPNPTGGINTNAIPTQPSQQNPLNLMNMMGPLMGGGQNSVGSLFGMNFGNMTLRQLIEENFDSENNQQQHEEEHFIQLFGEIKVIEIMSGMMSSNYQFLDANHNQIKEGLARGIVKCGSRQRLVELIVKEISPLFLPTNAHQSMLEEGKNPQSVIQGIITKKVKFFFRVIQSDFSPNPPNQFSAQIIHIMEDCIGSCITQVCRCLKNGLQDFEVIFKHNFKAQIEQQINPQLSMLVSMLYMETIWQSAKRQYDSYRIRLERNEVLEDPNFDEQEILISQNTTSTNNVSLPNHMETEEKKEENVVFSSAQIDEEKILEEITRAQEIDGPLFKDYQNIQFSDEYKKGDIQEDQQIKIIMLDLKIFNRIQ